MKHQEFNRPKRPGEAVKAEPLQVTVYGNSREEFESAVKLFKHQVQKEKIISKYKEYQSYEKPSDKKRRKRKESIEKRKSLANKMALIRSGEWEKRMKKRAKQRAEHE